MPLTKIRKFKENPFEIGWFYFTCIAGIATSIFVIIKDGQMPYRWVMALALLVYVRMASDLLWWFGDHPEEDEDEE